MNIPWATPLSENPIPLRPTDCGLLLELSLTLKLAEREVAVDGLNVMLTVQFPPGLRPAVHVLLPIVNADALVPPSVIPETVRAAVPALVTVTV